MSIQKLTSTVLAVAALTWGVVARAQNVLMLTDNSGVAANGATHVSDLIAAFTNAGATVTTNTTELTNGSAMAASLVTGRDLVITVTVTGAQIDAADVPVLQNAVNSGASRAFMFFTDACDGCTLGSANSALQILNTVGAWSATLGTPENTYPYSATLNGAGSYVAAFSSLPSILAGAYAPILGVPLPNVIYTADSVYDGPVVVVAPAKPSSACVFQASDTTEFWVTGGIITPAQANALAAAFLNSAMSSTGPCQQTLPVTPATWSATKGLYR